MSSSELEDFLAPYWKAVSEELCADGPATLLLLASSAEKERLLSAIPSSGLTEPFLPDEKAMDLSSETSCCLDGRRDMVAACTLSHTRLLLFTF